MTETTTGLSGVFASLARNLGHALQPALYSFAGAAVHTPMPYIGQISWVVPAVLAASNMYGRSDETSKLLTNKHEIAHHHHEIISDYAVSLGISAATYAIVCLNPVFAPVAVGAFFLTDIIAYGKDSPIDNFKSVVTVGLDHVLGDSF